MLTDKDMPKVDHPFAQRLRELAAEGDEGAPLRNAANEIDSLVAANWRWSAKCQNILAEQECWEYLVKPFEEVPQGTCADLASWLNGYGERRWQLVSIGTGPTVFKRTIQTEAMPAADILNAR